MSCPVCCERFNKSTHNKIGCPYCPFDVCSSCAERYLCDTPDDAHCMSCRKGWSREVLCNNFSKKFVSTTYKSRRENLLLEREKSLMPATQPYVEIEKQIRKLNLDIINLKGTLDTEYTKLSDINTIPLGPLAVEHRVSTEYEASVIRHKLATEQKKVTAQLHVELEHLTWHLSTCVFRMSGTQVENERRTFVRACPWENCRGFLSPAWKCGMCENWTCPDCHEVKGPTREAEHTCDPSNVATAQLLAKDSRNCPNCAAMIFKINGCFAKDTKIPMFDGTTKLAQDISIGDVLIGDDGTPRKVLDTCKGRDEMFKVQQNKGVEYTVNSKHKLVLKFSGHKSIYKIGESFVVRWFDKSIKSKKFEKMEEAVIFRDNLQFPDEIEMLVEDYMKLGDSTKKFMMGFKSSGVVWPRKEVRLDPYIMGLWLGDGINNGKSFAANDTEILCRILEWCEKNEAELVHSGPYKFDVRRRNGAQGRLAISRGATSYDCKGCSQKFSSICDTPNKPYDNDTCRVAQFNPLKRALDSYNLIRNKHIPLDYIVNDRDTRLKVLAGLIDSDGHVSHEGKRVVIIQTNPKITEKIEFLVRSLGFTVSVTTSERKNVSIFGGDPKDYKDIYRINISGEHLEEIPTILPRKKCANSIPNKDGLRTSIRVSSVGQGDYYGWMVDCNKRFVLEDFTVVRNCDQMYCTQCHTAFSWKTGRIETGVVHNPHYFEYQRARGTLARQPGDVPCGGFPDFSLITRILRREHVDYGKISRAYRSHLHCQYAMIPRYTVNAENDNRDLRIKLMIGDIPEDLFKKKIQQREKARQRKTDIRQVLEMYMAVLNDLFQGFVSTENITELTVSLDALRNHVTSTFKAVSARYTHCAVPVISEMFDMY